LVIKTPFVIPSFLMTMQRYNTKKPIPRKIYVVMWVDKWTS